MINLGQQVRDKVTGFEGIATARVEYLNGCIQYCIKPKATKEGACPAGEYIDDQQLEVVGDGIAVNPKVTGGPQSDTPRGAYRG